MLKGAVIMPRGVRKVIAIDDQIAEVRDDVETLEARLKAKKSELKQLEVRKRDQEMASLMNAIEKRGISIDDAINIISND